MDDSTATGVATAFPTHGGLSSGELDPLGIAPSDVLDVSVNVNPYGPSPVMRRAIAQAPIDRYPEPDAAPARHALAAWMGVDPARVVVGNGAVDLLWGLARVLCGAGDVVAVVEPAFSEMAAAARRASATVASHRTEAAADFVVDLDALDAFVRRTQPKLLYVASPSNPAGRAVPLRALGAIAERYRDTLFVVDVSFLSLSARHADASTPLPERVVRVQSLTKDHALAGIRVGFAVAPQPLAARLEAARPPWSVSGPAQAAAIVATTHEARRFVGESRYRLLRDRAYLESGLARLGLHVHPSDTVFCLVDLGPRVDATALRRALLVRHRVLVRDATSFGLPRHIRLAARPRRDTDRLLAALRAELGR